VDANVDAGRGQKIAILDAGDGSTFTYDNVLAMTNRTGNALKAATNGPTPGGHPPFPTRMRQVDRRDFTGHCDRFALNPKVLGPPNGRLVN
jgi:hypothetical protein